MINRVLPPAIVALALFGMAPALLSLGGRPVLQAAASLRWEADIQRFEAADRAQMPPPGALLFVGSSTIRKWTNLEAAFPNHQTIQRGFGGSTMADALRYLDRLVLPYKPREVFIYFGDNDVAAKRKPGVIVAEFKKLAAIVQKALPEARLWFISIKPSPKRWQFEKKAREVNDAIAAFVRGNPRLGFIDVWKPMLDETGAPRPELFVSDNLHLNNDGYALWARVISEQLK